MSTLLSTSTFKITHSAIFIHNTQKQASISNVNTKIEIVEMLKNILPNFEIDNNSENSAISFAFADLRKKASDRAKEMGTEVVSNEPASGNSSALLYAQLSSMFSKSE